MKHTTSPGFGKAFLICSVVVVAVVLYLLYMRLLGISDIWVSFIFLWYYGTIKQMSKADWLPSVCGSLFGFAMSGSLLWLIGHWGNLVGITVFVVFVFVLVLLLIMGRFGLLLNAATFLFVTVGTIPTVMAQQNFPAHFVALMIGIAFWSAISVPIWIMASRNARRSTVITGTPSTK